MKKTRFKKAGLLVLLFSFFYSSSQENLKAYEDIPESQIQEIEKAVGLYWKWDHDDEPKKAVTLLGEFSDKNPNNWLAPYWASYIATQISNADKNESAYLDKAQQYFNKARQAVGQQADSTTLSYFHGLQTLIYTLKSYREVSEEKAKELKNKSRESLNAGLKLYPGNPVLWVLSATSPNMNLRTNLGNVMASVALLKQAKREFSKISRRSPAAITYWNEHWIDPWLKNLTPPSMKKKQESAAQFEGAPSDFDFLIGEWEITNKILKERLSNNNEWRESKAYSKCWKILGGFGNMDDFRMTSRDGKIYRGNTIRTYNPKTKEWSLYWVDDWNLDLGVTYQTKGTFKDNIGIFYGEEMHKGKKVKIKFTWKKINENEAYWDQAYYDDAQEDWEINWIMTFKRI